VYASVAIQGRPPRTGKGEGSGEGIGTTVVEGGPGDKGAAVIKDDGEPGQSGGGGTRVLGISAIGTTHVAVNMVPPCPVIRMSAFHLWLEEQSNDFTFVVASNSPSIP
jgi:hypothetical protein